MTELPKPNPGDFVTKKDSEEPKEIEVREEDGTMYYYYQGLKYGLFSSWSAEVKEEDYDLLDIVESED